MTLVVDGVSAILKRHKFTSADEVEIQDAIGELFYDAGISFEREVSLTKADRIDFMLPGAKVGLEVKVQGTPVSILRQLHRYAQHESVDELMLVTTQQRHRVLPSRVDGKLLTVVVLPGAFG